MKMIAEYLEPALNFKRMAANEENQKFKGDLLKLAASYRKLATERSQKLGLPLPQEP
jgi:hypothetical protein